MPHFREENRRPRSHLAGKRATRTNDVFIIVAVRDSSRIVGNPEAIRKRGSRRLETRAVLPRTTFPRSGLLAQNNFRIARNPSRIGVRRGDHFLPTYQELPTSNTVHTKFPRLKNTGRPVPSSTCLGSHIRLSLTLDHTQGCTVGVSDAWCEEVNANRAGVQTGRRKYRRHSLL